MKLRRDGAAVLLLAFLLFALVVGRGVNRGSAVADGGRPPAGGSIRAPLYPSAQRPTYIGDFRYVRMAAGEENPAGPVLLGAAVLPGGSGTVHMQIPATDLSVPVRTGYPLDPANGPANSFSAVTAVASAGYSPAGIDFPNFTAGTVDERQGGGSPVIFIPLPGGTGTVGPDDAGGAGGDALNAPVVPLPGTLLLLGSGLGALAVVRRVRGR